MKARCEPTQLLDEGEERTFEESSDERSVVSMRCADHVEMRGDDAADHRLEQLDLGLEVEIGQALAHLGARGDVFEPRAGEALLGEFLEGRGDDLLRAHILVAAPPLALRGFGVFRSAFSRAMARQPIRWDPPNIMTDRSVLQWDMREILCKARE